VVLLEVVVLVAVGIDAQSDDHVDVAEPQAIEIDDQDVLVVEPPLTEGLERLGAGGCG